MKKRKESFLESIITVLVYSGLFYLIVKFIFSAKDSNKILFGIKGLTPKRKFIYYHEGDKQVFENELMQFDSRFRRKAEIVTLQLITNPELKGNFVKFFKNDTISGELIKDAIRIFFYKISEDEYLLTNIFLKQKNSTDEKFKQIARKRIDRYLQKYAS